jgi:hypothetical protein
MEKASLILWITREPRTTLFIPQDETYPSVTPIWVVPSLHKNGRMYRVLLLLQPQVKPIVDRSPNPVPGTCIMLTNVEFGNTNHRSGTRQVSFQIMSSLFGGASDKYLPMSAINGMRIIFSLENAVGAVVRHGLGAGTMTITLEDPTLFMNMVRVDPTVDAALLQAATGPDGSDSCAFSDLFDVPEFHLFRISDVGIRDSDQSQFSQSHLLLFCTELVRRT